MDQPGDNLLAAARLAADVYRRLAARQLVDLGAQVGDFRGFANQCRVLALGHAIGALQFQCIADQGSQPIELDGLADEVERARLQRCNGRVDAAVGGDHGDRNAGVVLLNVLDQADTVAVRQFHVREAEIGIVLLEGGVGFGEVSRGTGFQAHPAEGDIQQLPDIRLVVDNQYGFCTHILVGLTGVA